MEESQKKKVLEKKIILEFPIEVETEGGIKTTLTEVTLKRMKVKHLKILPSGFSKKNAKLEPMEMIPLVAAMSDLPEAFIEELDMEDLINIAQEMESFLSGAVPIQKIGKK